MPCLPKTAWPPTLLFSCFSAKKQLKNYLSPDLVIEKLVLITQKPPQQAAVFVT